MKKANIIINIVLLIAVAVLFVLHFSSRGGQSVENSAVQRSDSLQVPAQEIVYVNIDTLLAGYDMFHDFEGKFQEKQKSSEAKLDNRSKQWQNRVNNYQNMVQKGLITRSKAQEMQQQLGQEQQDLLKLKDDLASQLMEQQQVMNRQILFSIMEYLEKYNAGHRYKYILSNSIGGNLLYADKTLDITGDVISGINRYYAGIRDSVLQANR